MKNCVLKGCRTGEAENHWSINLEAHPQRTVYALHSEHVKSETATTAWPLHFILLAMRYAFWGKSGALLDRRLVWSVKLTLWSQMRFQRHFGKKTYGKTDNILFRVWVNDILPINLQIRNYFYSRIMYLFPMLRSLTFISSQTSPCFPKCRGAPSGPSALWFAFCCLLRHTVFLKGWFSWLYICCFFPICSHRSHCSLWNN